MEATSSPAEPDGDDRTEADNLKLLFGTELEALQYAKQNEWYSPLTEVCVVADAERIIQNGTTPP